MEFKKAPEEGEVSFDMMLRGVFRRRNLLMTLDCNWQAFTGESVSGTASSGADPEQAPMTTHMSSTALVREVGKEMKWEGI